MTWWTVFAIALALAAAAFALFVYRGGAGGGGGGRAREGLETVSSAPAATQTEPAGAAPPAGPAKELAGAQKEARKIVRSAQKEASDTTDAAQKEARALRAWVTSQKHDAQNLQLRNPAKPAAAAEPPPAKPAAAPPAPQG